jgi:hypothetical protein
MVADTPPHHRFLHHTFQNAPSAHGRQQHRPIINNHQERIATSDICPQLPSPIHFHDNYNSANASDEEVGGGNPLPIT